MADEDTNRFLVIISLGSTEPSRIAGLVPPLQTVLRSVSTETPEQAFRSVVADFFGYFIRSRLVARQIEAAIRSPGKESWQRDDDRIPDVGPFLDNNDGILVVEIGEDFLAGPW